MSRFLKGVHVMATDPMRSGGKTRLGRGRNYTQDELDAIAWCIWNDEIPTLAQLAKEWERPFHALITRAKKMGLQEIQARCCQRIYVKEKN